MGDSDRRPRDTASHDHHRGRERKDENRKERRRPRSRRRTPSVSRSRSPPSRNSHRDSEAHHHRHHRTHRERNNHRDNRCSGIEREGKGIGGATRGKYDADTIDIDTKFSYRSPCAEHDTHSRRSRSSSVSSDSTMSSYTPMGSRSSSPSRYRYEANKRSRKRSQSPIRDHHHRHRRSNHPRPPSTHHEEEASSSKKRKHTSRSLHESKEKRSILTGKKRPADKCIVKIPLFMPLFSSKSPHTYDQIPQSRSSSDSVVSDIERVEGFGEARNFAELPLPFESRNGEQINPLYISDADADSESSSSLLPINGAFRFLWKGQASSHSARNQRRRRRLRREEGNSFRTIKKWLRSVARHRLVPTKPLSILIFLVLLALFAVGTTFSLMYILNPDKAPVPWRIYCSIPSTSTLPPIHPIPALDEVFAVQLPRGVDPLSSPELTTPQFPPDNLDDLPPAGVFLGVFSIDSGMERRMLIRTTWASHLRSRFGATDSDNGLGTSRTIVRFVLGKPRSEWERRVKLEAETYNDIIILPIKENMNSGKSHAYFTWSAEHAWVPPPILSHPDYRLTYANESITAPPLAPHDPKPDASLPQFNWVRPDFVLKADDDTFIMLAELEARLRVQLDKALKPSTSHSPTRSDKTIQTMELKSTYDGLPHSDPLIYFGYLVKNHFMAGETYGFSWALTRWVSTEPKIRGMVHGAEDKQTAKWMQSHPRAHQIRWASERGWIYDHPRAGTVYSHGFLFPSEASRVRHSVLSLLRPLASISGTAEDTSNILHKPATTYIPPNINPNDTITYILPPQTNPTSPSFAYSSVSQFHKTYRFPLPGLNPKESIEALVEGSHMSKLIENGPETAAQAWMRREHLLQRYEGKRVGGTVVVHFIKRNEWFLETAMAFLGDDDPYPL